MLAIYRRHQPPCPQKSRRYRRCNCPIWVQGSLRAEYVRQSLDLRSWEAAADLVQGWEASGEVGVIKPEIPLLADAISKFIEDAKARKLGDETSRKYENLLTKRFLPWCSKKGYRFLKQVGVDAVREFRGTWDDSATYATKNLERMRSFFRFCEEAGWIQKNPARGVKAPKVRAAPTLPFTEEEMKRILAACERYPGNQERMKAFVLTMRYSGLRIGDTIGLEKSRLSESRLLLYTAKTGTPVHIPLPPVVMEALKQLDTNGSGRYFSTGKAKPQTARANWSRYLETVFQSAGILGGHSHRLGLSNTIGFWCQDRSFIA